MIQRGGSPRREEVCNLVVKGNCVAVRRGREQPETNDPSVTQVNSIRQWILASLLEQGVKGDKWFRLIDKVYAVRNLNSSFGKVQANQGATGVDHITVEAFGDDLETNLEKLSQSFARRPISLKQSGGFTYPTS